MFAKDVFRHLLSFFNRASWGMIAGEICPNILCL